MGISDEYVSSLCASNVIVNCERSTKMEGKTVATVDGNETEVAVLALATGFNIDGFLSELSVFGHEGVLLN